MLENEINHEKGILWFVISVLAVFILVVVRTKLKKSPNTIISASVLQERLNNYTPEDLVDYKYDPISDDVELEEPKDSCGVLNLARANFLNMLNDADIKDCAIKAIQKSGVGSCGPRGFYGSIEIHITLEERIADFMGLEEAATYSYGFSTVPSAICAYTKPEDIIFADEQMHFPARQGFKASRCKIVYFKHNDMVDLEEKLIEYQHVENKERKLLRKFLIVEGIYQRTGTICPLPELMRLRKKYTCRIFVDESISFGVLGQHGKGVTDHYKIDRTEVDMIMGSLEGSIGSIGGFCVGASVIIERHRIYGVGYMYSASLPPYLSAIAVHALDKFEANPNQFEQLSKMCLNVDKMLRNIQNLIVFSDALSPVKVFAPRELTVTVEDIQKYCADEKLLILRNDDSTLTMNVHVGVTNEDVQRIDQILRKAIEE